MQVTITVIGPNMKKYDIQIDNKQHLKTTLRVLGENIGELAGIQKGAIMRIKSSGRLLDLQKTYEEEQVYTGAEILILPTK